MPNLFQRIRPWCAGIPAVLLGCALVVPSARAQQAPPLGELARKEQERRKSLPSATRVYTNKDLPDQPPRPADGPAPPLASPTLPLEASAPGAAAAAAQPDAPAEAGTTPPSAAKDEAWWKERIGKVREQLRRSEVFAEALQSRINALSRDFLSRDDPAQRGRIGGERSETLNELARVKQEIERGRKEIADIEEEARKAGVPPGWLR